MAATLQSPTTLAAPTAAAPLEGLAFLTPEVLRTLFAFSPGTARAAVEPNHLDTQQLVAHCDLGWRRERN